MHEEKYNFHLHIHQFVELTLVLEGELCVSVSGREPEVARKGDFILIFPFQSHKYSSSRVNKFVIYTFSPHFISELLSFLDGRVGDGAVFRASDSTFRLFEDKLIANGDYSIFTIMSCLYAMASDFLGQANLVSVTLESDLIEKLVACVNKNYSRELSLEAVAKEIGYSANYLSHCIKRSFTFGYPTLLACVRIEHAKPLIMEGKKTSLEISLECGFGSERSFNRQFKEITGLTPREYRKSNRLNVINRGLITDYSTYPSPALSKKDKQVKT